MLSQLSPKLTASLGTGQDCAASGYWSVAYLHRPGSASIVGRIGRTSDRRWHVVLGGEETYVRKHEQALHWVNSRA